MADLAAEHILSQIAYVQEAVVANSFDERKGKDVRLCPSCAHCVDNVEFFESVVVAFPERQSAQQTQPHFLLAFNAPTERVIFRKS